MKTAVGLRPKCASVWWCVAVGAVLTLAGGAGCDGATAGAGPSSDDNVARGASAIARPPVTRRVAVLLLHYGQPLIFDPAFYRSVLFDGPNSVRAFYLDATYGAVRFEGDVFDWIPTERAPTCDDRAAISTRAVAAAAAAHIDLTPYDHVAAVLADTCRNGGAAEIGTPAHPGRHSVYWAATSEFVFAHELGHNLGLAHSLGADCGNGASVPLGLCAESVGSPYDLMGESLTHFNAYNKAQEGWLDGCNVVTASADGEFTLAPIELATTEQQLLRFQAGNGMCSPQTGTPCYYYIEYRQPIGWDARFPDNPSFHGATIYMGGELDRNAIGHPTALLDMHPPGPGQGINFFDAPLPVGETFVEFNGNRVTVLSDAGQRLRVRLEKPGGTGAPTCLPSTTSRVTATFQLSSQSATSYCGDISIRNTSTTLVTDWSVAVDVQQSSLTSGWNGTFTPQGGSRYLVTPVAWNRDITPGNAIAVGMCANKLGPSFLPQILSTTSN